MASHWRSHSRVHIFNRHPLYMVIHMSKEEEKKSYTKCYSIDLHHKKNKYLKTYVYSDNYGKDIVERFKPHKVFNIKRIDCPKDDSVL